MGSSSSKNPKRASSHIKTQMSSYSAACKIDRNLHSFDTTLHARTNQFISTLAGGVEVRTLSLESLKQLTECLLDMNQEVVKVILDCKKDIWKSEELFNLVDDYFDTSLKTLDFCSVLEKSLKRARDTQLFILLAVKKLEEDGICTKTMSELKSLKEVGEPFTNEFFETFQCVYKQQMSMLKKLKYGKRRISQRLKRAHAWRRVSCVIFVATFATVLICSVVAAAMAAPPVAAALAAASSIPLGSMGKWIDSLWKNYEDVLKGQKEVISSMQVGNYVTIKDLDNIRLLVDRVVIEMGSFLEGDFCDEEINVGLGIKELKGKLDVFMKNVDELSAQADMCGRDIRRARTVILQRIINHPSSQS